MNKYLLVSILTLFGFLHQGQAQVNSYGFSQTTGTYAPISGGIVIGLPNDDGTIYNSIPIGFNFNFNNKVYNVMSMSTNGFVVMGPDTAANAHYPGYFVLSTLNTMNNLIAVYNDDLALGTYIEGNYTAGDSTITNLSSTAGISVGDVIDVNGNFVPTGTTVLSITGNTIKMSKPSFATATADLIEFANGEMRVQTIGTAPNRICVVQWKNAHKIAEFDDCYNFQIRLYENTSRVQMIYNVTNNNSTAWEVQVGLTGNSRSDFNCRTTTTNWSATTAGNTNSKSCSTSNVVFPPLGLTYNWDPCYPATAPTIAASNTNPCANDSVTLSITNGSLGSGTAWQWRSGSCNGPVVGTGSTITVTPTSNITYFAKGSGGCLSPSMPCGQVALTVKPVPTIIASVSPTSLICPGTNVTLNGTGGSNITWSNGVTNGVAFPTVFPSPTYTVTGTAANGCTNTSTIKPNLITPATINVTCNPNTFSACPGQPIVLNASGASNLSWTGGISNNTTFTLNTTTTFTVSGTDANGCTATTSVTITIFALPNVSANSNASNNTVCQGSAITLSGSGANTYTWSGGVNNNTPFALNNAGTYTVTGTDLNGCANTATIALNVYSLPNILVLPNPTNATICEGGNITLSGNGANTYSWTGGVTDATAFTLNATSSFTVTGTDNFGCTNTAVQLVTVNPLPNISIAVTPTIAAVCPGGSATLNATGAPTINWSNSVSNNIGFVPNATNIYTVTATSASGCISTATQQIIVESTPTIVINATPPSGVICSGASITLHATQVSNVSWTGGITNNNAFVPTASTVYTVTGASAAGCTSVTTFLVTVNALPTLTIAASPASASICAGSAMLLNATGAPTISWNPTVGNNTSFVPLNTTVYTVTGTLANGCSNTNTILVTVKPVPSITITAVPANAIVCSGQTMNLTASGATSYTWTGGVINGNNFTPTATTTYTVTGTTNGCNKTATRLVTVNPLPTISVQANPSNATVCNGAALTLNALGAVSYTWSPSINNNTAFVPVSSGIYTVTGTAANGCTRTATRLVTVNALPTLTVSTTPSNATICQGASMVLNATTNGSSVSWSPSYTNNTVFNPATSGVYTVTVSNSSGCTKTQTQAVTVNSLPNLNVSAVPSNFAICLGASITVNGNGGSNYSYTGGINDGIAFLPTTTNTYTMTASGTNGCDGSTVFTITVNPLPSLTITSSPANGVVCAGNPVTLNGSGASTYSWSNGISDNVAFVPTASNIYTLSGVDANGCANTATQAVTVNALPNITIAANPLSAAICQGNSIALTASGASTYTWSPNITNGVAFIPTSSGIYNVSGTDANGCLNTASIAVNINSLPALTIAATPANATICIGDQIKFTTSGASTYSWSNGISENTFFSPTTSGTYTVTGTNGNGCVSTATISIIVNPLPVITIASVPANATICAGSSFTFTASGASTYTWSPSITNGVAATATATTIYTVTATNTNGCVSTSTKTLTVNSLPTISINATPTSATICQGSAITLNASGASTYTWNPSVVNGTAFTPASSGVYTVTGTNSNGCVNTNTILVNVNALPSLTITPTPANATICIGDQIKFTTSGASTYSWSNGISENTFFSPTTSGTYTVTGTNGNGCVSTATISIIVNSLPVITISSVPANATICAGSSFTFTASGASTYTWSPSITNGVAATATATTIYTVTATNTNGCVSTSTKTLTVNSLPTISINASPALATVCQGGAITLNATGASTYTWNPNIVNGTAFTPASSGIYTVSATNGNGCVASASIAVTVNPLPTLTIYATPTNATVCQGESLTLNAIGASTYTWNPNVTNNSAFVPTSNGVYTVTAASAAGCTKTSTIGILVNPKPTLSIVFSTNNSTGSFCAGTNLSMSATGASSYTWSPAYTSPNTIVASNSTVYTVTGTATNGCTNSVTRLLNILPLPPKPVITPANDFSICANQTYVISGSVAAGTTKSWNIAVNENIPTLPLSGINNFILTATATNGCVNRDTLKITTLAVPNVNISKTPNTTVCAGSSFTLVPGGAQTYTFNPAIVPGPPFVVTQPSNAVTYTLTGTAANGCTNTSVVTATPGMVPSFSITANPSPACENGPLALNATSANTAMLYAYTPMVVGSNTVTPINNVNFTVPGAGLTYTVTATYTVNNCTATATITPLVNAAPPISITSVPANALNGIVCAGTNVIVNTTSLPNAIISYTPNLTNNTSFVPLVNQTYTVTATNNGCSSTSIFTINVESTPTLTLQSTADTICDGQSVTLTASSTNGNVSIANGIQSGISFVPTNTSIYTATVTTSNGCTATAIKLIVVLPQASITITGIPANNTICSGASVTLNASSNGSAISWSNGIINNTSFTPVSTNTYIVTATNANGCTSTSSVIIYVTPTPTLTFNALPGTTICNGTAVTINVTSNGSFVTSGFTNNVSFVPSATSTYTATASIGNCVFSSTITIAIAPSPTVAITAPTNSNLCINATYNFTASASTGASISWNPAIVNPYLITPNTPSVFTVTATSANGCTASATKSFTILQAPVLNLAINPGDSVCRSSAYTLSAISGSPGLTITNTSFFGALFTYLSPTTRRAFANSTNQSAVTTTTLTVNATFSNGCAVSATKVLFVKPIPNVPTIAVSSPNPCQKTPFTITGGNTSAPPITYAILAPPGNPPVTNGTSFIIGGLSSNYTIVATNSFGCTRINLSGPSNFSVRPAPTVSVSASPSAICQGQSFTPTVTSNATSNTIALSGGLINNAPFVPSATNVYTATATGTNGCTASSTTQVVVNAAPTLTLNITPPSGTICSGQSVTIEALSSNGTVTTTGFTSGVGFTPNATAVYTISVAGANGCNLNSTTSIIVNPMPNISFAITPNTICSGATVTPTASSTTPNTTISLSNGLQNNVPVALLTSATYTATATNASGCSASATALVTVSPTLTLSLSTNAANNTICSGQSIIINATSNGTVTANGFTSGVAFVPTATTVYTVTSSNASCNITSTITVTVLPTSTFTITKSFATTACTGVPITININTSPNTTVVISPNLNLGTPFTLAATTNYTFTVTNANGCASTSVLNVPLNTTPTIVASATPNNVCPGTTFTLNASTIGVLSFIGASPSIGLNTAVTAPNATTVYTLTATGLNGCNNTTTLTLTVKPSPSATVNASPINACVGDPLTLLASGAPSNTYQWTGSSGSPSITNGVPFTVANQGGFSLLVSNVITGCSKGYFITLNIQNKPNISFSINPNGLCLGNFATPTVTSSVTNVAISNGLVNNQQFQPLSTSVYTATATGATGCTRTSTASVTILPTPTLTAVSNALNDEICDGSPAVITAASNGSLTIIGSLITNIGNNIPFYPTADDVYTIMAVNAAGCSDFITMPIYIRPLPQFDFVTSSEPDSIICVKADIILSAQSGTAIIDWFPVGTVNNNLFPINTSTVFTVVATDVTGCTNSATVPFVVVDNPDVTITQSPMGILCENAMVNLSIPSTADALSWSGGITNGVDFAAQLNPNSYTVTAINAGECIATSSVTLNVAPAPVLTITPVTQTLFPGNSASILASGAQSYSWSGGISNGVAFLPNSSSQFTVTATGANGCTATGTADVIVIGFKPIDKNDDVKEFSASLFPNPIYNEGVVKINAPYEFTATIIITNSIGQTVQRIETNVQKGSGEVNVDVSHLTNGKYLMTIRNNTKELQTIQFVKQ
jgi:hypothetical protein